MTFDLERARLETPGIAHVLHFNNAGSALPSQSVLDATIAYLEREAQIGGRTVRILEIEQVGNYAIRPTFDDGHSTGIFTWAHLAQLGRDDK